LNGAASYLPYYDRDIAGAAQVTPGVPVVFFVDWPAEADRLASLPRTDQLHFMHLYLPEAYAAGGEFALPLRGFRYVSATQDTIGTLALKADYYREWYRLLRGSRPGGEVSAPEGVAARLRTSPAGTVLHLVNHRWDRAGVRPIRGPCQVELPAAAVGKELPIAVSTGWLEQRPVPVEQRGAQLRVSVELETNAMVIFPARGAWRRVAGRAPAGVHIQAAGARAAALTGVYGRFHLLLPPDYTGELFCLETGEMQPAQGRPVFRRAPPAELAAGVIVDSCGVPARHARFTVAGATRWTDAWGRFCAPVTGEAAELQLGPPLPRVAVRAPAGTCEIRLFPEQSIADADVGLLGWWPNWSSRTRSVPHPPATIEFAEHLGRPAMAITFRPKPRVSWMNTNSPRVWPQLADGLEITYAGDGADGTVAVACQVFGSSFAPPRKGDTFYRALLPRRTRGWKTVRLPWREFVTLDGERLDGPRRMAVQFAPAAQVVAETRIWVSLAKPYRDGPASEHRRASPNGTLAGLDVEDRFRGHKGLRTLRLRSGPRTLLQRFDGDEPLPFANWAGREENGPTLMKAALHRPGRGGGHIRIRFGPKLNGWANLNLPLPAGATATYDGVVLHLRTERSDTMVRLGVHVHAGGAPGVDRSLFLTTDAMVAPGEWTEVTLPWSEFGSRSRVDLKQATGLSFQIIKPEGVLKRAQVIELDDFGLWRSSGR